MNVRNFYSSFSWIWFEGIGDRKGQFLQVVLVVWLFDDFGILLYQEL
jgi:hypothetical protein